MTWPRSELQTTFGPKGVLYPTLNFYFRVLGFGNLFLKDYVENTKF